MYKVLPIIIIVVAIAVGFLGGGDEGGSGRGWQGPGNAGGGGSARRPSREPDHGGTTPWKPGDQKAARGGRTLPPPSSRDPQVLVEVPVEVRNSSGTAFSIAPNGVWMSARHVADGCEKIYILTAPRQGMRVRRIYLHPTADVAILKTDRGVAPLRFSSAVLRQGQQGFHIGYPAGQPGDVNSSLIGRSVLYVRGRYRTSEPVIAWAEQIRVPDTWGGLGGISGGPAFDELGRVIGINVAGSKRRGRVFTAAPVSIQRALQRASVKLPGDSTTADSLTKENFANVGGKLRRTLRVAKVLCFAPPGARRPRYR